MDEQHKFFRIGRTTGEYGSSLSFYKNPVKAASRSWLEKYIVISKLSRLTYAQQKHVNTIRAWFGQV